MSSQPAPPRNSVPTPGKTLSPNRGEGLGEDGISWFPLAPLGEIAEFINGDRGTNYPSKSDFVDVGIPFINAGHLTDGVVDFAAMNYISENRFNKLGSGKTKANDLLYCLRGSLGKTAIVHHIGDAAIASSLVIIRPGEECSVEYLYRYLTSPFGEEEIRRFDNGSSQPNLSATNVKKYQIPLPPLAEQKRIAGILDAADALRARRRESLAQLDTLLQSTFLEMFGDPVTNPMGWEEMTLGCLAGTKPNNGIFRKNPEYSESDDLGVPVVWVEELFRGNDIDTSNSRRLEATPNEVEKYGLRYGDILFCRSSLKLDGIAFNNVFLGKAGDALFECHLIRLSPKLDIADPIFLSFQLRSVPMRAVLKAKSKTATMTTIDQKALSSVEVVVPPLKNQQRFASIVESVEQQKVAQRAHLMELDTLFAALQQRAFGGEL